MSGTDAADILIGGRGDDVFHSGAGADHIDGGEGVDEAVFDGPAEAYTITETRQGYRVDGPQGTTFLRDIERLGFATGVVDLRQGTADQ